jgi:hypothetical protein
MPGPFTLPSAENDLNEKKKRAAIAQVKKWAESYIPAEVLQNHDCIVDVSEIQCGDPNCAPIDTVVRLLFKGNVGCVVVIFCVYMCFFWNWNLPSLSLSLGCLASHTLGFFSRAREGFSIFFSFARDVSFNRVSSQFIRLYR